MTEVSTETSSLSSAAAPGAQDQSHFVLHLMQHQHNNNNSSNSVNHNGSSSTLPRAPASATASSTGHAPQAGPSHQHNSKVTVVNVDNAAPRSYTILKEVGDGSFGTVWLADWHSPLRLPPGTLPPGPSSRPEYRGKKIVAVKRMKKAFLGGWSECLKLKELHVSLPFFWVPHFLSQRFWPCSASLSKTSSFPFAPLACESEEVQGQREQIRPAHPPFGSTSSIRSILY